MSDTEKLTGGLFGTLVRGHPVGAFLGALICAPIGYFFGGYMSVEASFAMTIALAVVGAEAGGMLADTLRPPLSALPRQ